MHSESYPEPHVRMLDALPAPGEIIDDLPRLAATMGEVALAAPGVGLPHLRYGLRAYQRVTEVVTEEAEAGRFEYPEKMMRTMPRFAKRIFDPIEHHTRGNFDQVGPWEHMFYAPAAREALPSTSMVDFLGFHVLYDLPFTLQSTQTEQKHKKDYTKQINIILAQVGNELHPEYIRMHPAFEKARLPELGLSLTMRHLYLARNVAWHSFRLLQTFEDDSGQLPPEAAPSLRVIDRSLGTLAASTMLSTKKPAAYLLKRFSTVPAGYWDIAEESSPFMPPSVAGQLPDIADNFPIN